jgi:hypothetical protein
VVGFSNEGFNPIIQNFKACGFSFSTFFSISKTFELDLKMGLDSIHQYLLSKT